MKIVVVSSDKYVNLLNGFSRLFNRHWSENKEVDILCYNKPDFKLPKNFNVISLGDQSGDCWTAPLRSYFNELEDDYFLLLLEDHFMFKDMDFSLLDKAEEEIKKDTVSKVVCTYDPNMMARSGAEYSDDFGRWNQDGDSPTSTSLCASIWKKDLFMKYIEADLRIHNFESQERVRDGREVLFPKDEWVYPQLDACRSGGFQNRILEDGFRGGCGQFVDSDDKEFFEQARRDLYDPSLIDDSDYYGQWETDRIIEKYFDKDFVGTCVEVGAADGIKGSNTKYFEDKGWKTLCIEPNPLFKDSLYEERAEVVMSAVGEIENESVDFNVFIIGKNNIMSSISGLVVDDKLVDSHKHLIRDNYKIKVPVKRLDNILESQGYDKEIDFISVDTESSELDVLKSIDLSEWNVKILVVENNHNDPDIEIYLGQFGYKKDRRYKVNDFYVRSNL